MVDFRLYGWNRGKIDLTLDRYEYFPGDAICGKVSLNLNIPIKSGGLKVQLLGERTRTRFVRTREGGRQERQTCPIFDFSTLVAGAKEYLPLQEISYDFSITIPRNVLDQAPLEIPGPFIPIFKPHHRFLDSVTRWYVTARLEIPWAIDLKKQVQINIL